MTSLFRLLLALSVSIGAVVFLEALGLQGGPIGTGPATEKRFPPLKLPPGFKATLFACDPLIEYPSVIAIGPRPGAIFVAIDYMTGLGTDGEVKSEIRLVEDTDGDGHADKATVVAKGFNSIQGLAYHDGTLFVMHAPFLSTVRDGKRTDLLTGLGLKPEDNPARLHCANGVVVGHDGWLYLALGDNGVNVLRPEGDRLIHNGGAILRCRPDGRDLHVFSTGLRNIYDIALDADLNVFTRDNENDGGTYMIRVCHCFHGSDHGYPYDYEERPDHAMKPIGDFGLGSSAGGVCYLETQFPKEYRGNLFFCEWGKSVVRYELKRAGSGFAPVKELEFASGNPKDTYPFKPTDIVVQRDGTLMVSDYADGQRPKRGRGRIYHVKHAGGDVQPLNKQPKSDLDKLHSDSYFERWEAQIAFERRGDAGRQELGDAFRANRIGPLAMNHALQALSKGGGGTGLGDMLALVTDPNPTIRLPAIRIIADLTDPILVKHKVDAGRGDAAIAKTLAKLNKRDDPRVMLEIVIALGRLRWAGVPDWLAKNLRKPDDALAHAAMQTLRRADSWPAVLKLLDEPASTPIRRIALNAVADRYETVVVDGLLERVKKDTDASRRREYAEALTRVYKKPGPWKYWGYRPGPRPANTEALERTDAIARVLDWALADAGFDADVKADADLDARVAILKRMRREKIPIATGTLGKWIEKDRHGDRAAAVIEALGEQSDEEAGKVLYRIVLDKKHVPANRVAALDLYCKRSVNVRMTLEWAAMNDLGAESGPVLAAVLRRLSRMQPPPIAVFSKNVDSPDADVCAAAIEALGLAHAKEGRQPVLRLLQDKDVRVRRAAAIAAGQVGATEAKDQLLKLLADADADVRGNCLDSLAALGDLRAVPIAVRALHQRGIDRKALAYLSEAGGADQIGAVVGFAKQNPASAVPPQVVGVLLRWRDRMPAMEAQQRAIDRAIADVHGATGVLTSWHARVGVSVDSAPKVVQDVRDKIPLDWTRRIASGAESQLRLQAAEAARKDTVAFAATELAVLDATSIEFLASSRGSLQVWLNGKSVYRRDQPRKFQPDSDRFPATLSKGTNRILVATGPGDGGVEFHLRFRRKSSRAIHEKLTQAALSRAGNPERGRKVFFDKDKSQCIKCHQLGNQGERIGPELTGVGGRFSRIYLVESILEPSRTIAPSFGTVSITLKNGMVLSGVKIGEDDKAVTLADSQGQKRRLLKSDIDEQNLTAVSTMPEGLELRLSEDEFVDLIAFLAKQTEMR